jgi:hypothetical protein
VYYIIESENRMLRSKRLSTRGSKNSSALETFKEIRSGKSALDQLSVLQNINIPFIFLRSYK